jgi:hypothetical protein
MRMIIVHWASAERTVTVMYDPDEFFGRKRENKLTDCGDCITRNCMFRNRSADDVCRWFTPKKPITNADRIRQMSDAELAEWLEEHCFQYGWLDWLKEETE